MVGKKRNERMKRGKWRTKEMREILIEQESTWKLNTKMWITKKKRMKKEKYFKIRKCRAEINRNRKKEKEKDVIRIRKK